MGTPSPVSSVHRRNFVGVRIIENTLFVPNSDPHEISSMNRGDRTGGKAREKIYYISIKMGCSVTLYNQETRRFLVHLHFRCLYKTCYRVFVIECELISRLNL